MVFRDNKRYVGRATLWAGLSALIVALSTFMTWIFMGNIPESNVILTLFAILVIPSWPIFAWQWWGETFVEE